MAEQTSPEITAIAARGLARPESLTDDEIRAVCASALTQTEPVAVVEEDDPGPGFVITP